MLFFSCDKSCIPHLCIAPCLSLYPFYSLNSYTFVHDIIFSYCFIISFVVVMEAHDPLSTLNSTKISWTLKVRLTRTWVTGSRRTGDVLYHNMILLDCINKHGFVHVNSLPPRSSFMIISILIQRMVFVFLI